MTGGHNSEEDRAPDRKRPGLGGVGEAGKLSVRKSHFHRDAKTGEKEVA